jgi:hypothetical protein
MEKNHCGLFSSWPAQLGTDPGPLPCAKPARYHTRAPVADDWDPPVKSHFPNPLPAPADPHHRRDSGQTVMRASGQGCLVLPCPILSLLADDCGSYHHLTSAASSPFRRSAVPSLHSGDVSARSLIVMPCVAHPTDEIGVAEGVSSRPWRNPTGVRAWPPRCGVLARHLAPRGHHSAHPFQRG